MARALRLRFPPVCHGGPGAVEALGEEAARLGSRALLVTGRRGLREAGSREGHDFAVVPDRREAIAQALAMAVDEDVVLLTGKGHEREVVLAGGSYGCQDGEVAARVLRELSQTSR